MKSSRSTKKFNKHVRSDLEITRVASVASRSFSDGHLRAAATLVDLTPAWGADLGGVGYKAGGFTDKMLGRLFATVVLLDDGRGNRLLLIACDLHSGSRYISESLGAKLASASPALGVGVQQTWMLASHTHSGPGHLYGELFYDQLASKKNGFDRVTATEITDKLYSAVAPWADSSRLKRVKLGTASSLLWHWLWNRSQMGYLANNYEGTPESSLKTALDPPVTKKEAEYARSASSRVAGVPAPKLSDDDLGRYCVDPRLQGIHIVDLEDQPVATIALLHATPTVVPAGAKCLTGDVAALAASELRRRMGRPDYPINIVAGAMGDVNIVDADCSIEEFRNQRGSAEELDAKQWEYVLDVAQRASDALAVASSEMMSDAAKNAKSRVPIAVRFGEWDLVRAPLNDGRQLAREHAVGKSSLAGSELSRPIVLDKEKVFKKFRESSYKRHLAGESVIKALKVSWPGNKRKWDHVPKATADVEAMRRLSSFEGIHPAALITLGHQAQLRFASLGDINLVGWPVEPSVGLSERLCRSLGGEPDKLMLFGLVGGFIGYATTKMEYRVQDYEGASNLWGANFGDWLIERTSEMGANAHSKETLDTARFATFPVWKKPVVSHPPAGRKAQRAPENEYLAIYDAAQKKLSGSWLARDLKESQANENIGSKGWIVRLRQRGAPLKLGDVEVNDVNFPILIKREVFQKKPYAKWSFELKLGRQPEEPLDELSFDVVPAAPFEP